MQKTKERKKNMARTKKQSKAEISQEEIEMLVKDIPFFHSTDAFCLGKNLVDAGEMVSKFFSQISEKEGNSYD